MWKPERVHFDSSPQLCEHVAANTGDVCLLNFSGGKDSIGLWLQVRRYFKRVIPVYRFHVPGLKFVERSLKYYEDFFDTKIERVCDPYFMRRLHDAQYQPPKRILNLMNARFTRVFEQAHLTKWAREKFNVPNAWTASGRRAADSMRRRVTMQRFGVVKLDEEIFYACFDWRESDVERELWDAGVHLPIDYRLFPRSFESIRYPYCLRIKEEFPEDFQTLLKWFPLLEADIARRRFWREERG